MVSAGVGAQHGDRGSGPLLSCSSPLSLGCEGDRQRLRLARGHPGPPRRVAEAPCTGVVAVHAWCGAEHRPIRDSPPRRPCRAGVACMHRDRDALDRWCKFASSVGVKITDSVCRTAGVQHRGVTGLYSNDPAPCRCVELRAAEDPCRSRSLRAQARAHRCRLQHGVARSASSVRM